MRKHIPLQSLFFLVGEEIAHCPLTVPGGDTPCLTAGDARRANPWDGDADNFSTPEVSHSIHFYSHISLLPQRLQCDAAGVRG